MVELGSVVLEAAGIEKYFGSHHVLRGLDLSVRQHETVMLIGRSGSGKTTFLRCLNFLEEPSAGRVRMGDVSIEADPLQRAGRRRASDIRQIRQRTGLLFQDFNLFPHMSVLENCIEAPMHVRGKSRQEAIATAERFLDKVRLIDKRDEYPARISGARSSALPSREPSAWSPRCCSSTSPPAPSTRTSSARSSPSWRNSPTRAQR